MMGSTAAVRTGDRMKGWVTWVVALGNNRLGWGGVARCESVADEKKWRRGPKVSARARGRWKSIGHSLGDDVGSDPSLPPDSAASSESYLHPPLILYIQAASVQCPRERLHTLAVRLKLHYSRDY